MKRFPFFLGILSTAFIAVILHFSYKNAIPETLGGVLVLAFAVFSGLISYKGFLYHPEKGKGRLCAHYYALGAALALFFLLSLIFKYSGKLT